MKTLLVTLALAALLFFCGRETAERQRSGAAGRLAPVGLAALRPMARPRPGPVAVAATRLTPSAAPAGPPDASALSLAAAIDALSTAGTPLGQKRAIWAAMRKAGVLDEAVSTLKALAEQSPNDAEIKAALGETLIYQAGALLSSGADPNAAYILALQADQNFNQAMALDPSNWDAQYFKAAALMHWPAGMNQGPVAIQVLTTLIAQQEAAPSQPPEYAQTYLLLGQQYQAAGDPAQAARIWQAGLSRFPANAALLQKVTGAAN